MTEKKKYNQNPKIVVTKEVKEKLDKVGNKSVTYNEIIEMLLESHAKLLSKN